jgi:hypothetical protein
MSTVRADNYGNRVGSSIVPVSTITEGTAKAFVTFEGDAVTITALDSYNVTSLTDGGTGLYTANYTNSFLAVSGPVIYGCEWIDRLGHGGNPPATTSMSLICGQSGTVSATLKDGGLIMGAKYGDLA